MNSGHDEKFDGLFGDEGADQPRPERRAPLAGLFGLNRMALRPGDWKSPADFPAEAGEQVSDAR